MKRTREEEEDRIVTLPPEIIDHVGVFVKSGCYRPVDYLNWCAACVTLWTEYRQKDIGKLILLCKEKMVKNEALLVDTLLVEYKNNFIEWSLLECMLPSADFIIEHIKSHSHLLGKGVFSKESGFLIPFWVDMDCVLFEEYINCEGEEVRYLTHASVIMMNALYDRIFARYGWRLYFDHTVAHSPPNIVSFPLQRFHVVHPDADLYIR